MMKKNTKRLKSSFIPNLATVFNMFLGFFAITLIQNGQPIQAGWVMMVAIFFDVIEGYAYNIGILTDNYGDEVSWNIIDQNNIEIASGNNLLSNSLNEYEICLEYDSCYIFTIYDSYNDGICCDFGNGFFSIFGRFWRS